MKQILCILTCTLCSISVAHAQFGGMHFSAPAPVTTAPAVHTAPPANHVHSVTAKPAATDAKAQPHPGQHTIAPPMQVAPGDSLSPKKKKRKKKHATDSLG